MLSIEQLEALMADLESDRVERTVSTKDRDKFCQAVCAFSNDLPGHRQPGYLLIGVDDAGRPSGADIGDEFLAGLGGTLRSDGNIQPLPAIAVEALTLGDGRRVAVVTVQPSDMPPVHYKGRCHIRVGPRRAIATPAEERLLSERRTALATSFDARPCPDASLSDLALDQFTLSYRTQAIDPDVVLQNNRDVEEQLAALRFFDLGQRRPTYAGVLLFGKDVLRFVPGAYVQFVRFAGTSVADAVESEQVFSDNLYTTTRELDTFLRRQIRARPEARSLLREEQVEDYPHVALRELVMNALVHRWYDGGHAPTRIAWFSDRVEIQSPGGLYGNATPENFPRQNAYRNPVLAEALKVLGYVNRFGFGVERARAALRANGSPEARFEFDRMFVLATVSRRP